MATPCMTDSATVHLEQDAGTGALVADVINDPSSDNLLSASGAGLLARYAPELDTTLPAAPFDGQVSYYDSQDGFGTIWQLRYNDASASAYKWEFVGGGVIFARVDTEMTRTAGGTAYTSGTGSDCQVTLPGNLEGDWYIRHGCRINATSNGSALQTVKLGTAAAADQQAVASNATDIVTASSQILHSLALPAGSILVLRYANMDAAHDAKFSYRWLEARPWRVKAA